MVGRELLAEWHGLLWRPESGWPGTMHIPRGHETSALTVHSTAASAETTGGNRVDTLKRHTGEDLGMPL